MDARGDLNPTFSATGQALSAPPLELYLGAVDTLVQWQLASQPGVLPPYDHTLLLRELELFPQWYITEHRQVTLDAAQRKVLDDTFALLIENNLSWPSVYVHRDFMPRNLMVPNEAPTLGTGVSSLPPEGALAARGGPAPLTPVSRVAVIAYPRISNLDEFQPLKNIPGLRLQWVRSPTELAGLKATDWIILPGSKHTSGDLAWLRSQGLDAEIAQHAKQGGAVLGVCGGLQMLGEALIDPHGIDGNAPGLGLLPLVTVFDQDKTVRHSSARFVSNMAGYWASLADTSVSGYEIHHGQTQQHVAMAAAGDVAHSVLPDGLGWCNASGNVLGLYLHGMFEDASVLQALFGAQLGGAVPTLETVFDGLADFIETHFEPGVLQDLLN
jgi:adenosylcobyric acid synthase